MLGPVRPPMLAATALRCASDEIEIRHPRAGAALALLPAFCWAPGRAAHAPLTAVLAGAAPLGWALAAYIDPDMRSLGDDVARLEQSRYKFKKV